MSRMTLPAILLLSVAGCAAPQHHARPLPPPITSTGHAPPAPRVKVARPVPPPPPRLEPPPPRTLNTPIHASFIVDPGHGGNDPGAKGVSARPEKTITLEIARKLTNALRDRASNVVMSRGDDTFISLNGRAALADRHRVDLFVSIHADSAPRAGASGATVYVARNASAQSRAAAKDIDAALRRAGFETRGVKTAGFRVLVGHSRPAVLIECGYLTNRGDATRLNDGAYQEKLVNAIVAGLEQHFMGK